MSRAVRILKPVQNEKDLEDTTRRLIKENRLNANEITSLAAEYTAYQRNQPVANFHGLRDYYALIKGLGGDEELTPAVMRRSLARNFGGSDEGPEKLFDCFFPRWNKRVTRNSDSASFPSALECIMANLGDANARHLMVIGESDLIIDVLENCLSVANSEASRARKRPRVIYGSQFTEDQGPAYAYGVLNTILLCVEEGRPVILKNLEIIYGMENRFCL